MLERVTFHGHIENIADAFAVADIFAYPLTPGSYVTSEKALQEAMWVGVPPVLLEGTAASGWIDHGVTGFIARDIADFARILALLSADPALRRRIGRPPAPKRGAVSTRLATPWRWPRFFPSFC